MHQMAPSVTPLTITWLLSMTIQNGFSCEEDRSVRYMADYLLVKYEVLENDYASGTISGYLGRMNFTNSGNETIRSGNWSIYFSHTRALQLNGADSSRVSVHHYNGILYWLQPTDQFSDLLPGQTLSLTFIGSDWMVARTDSLPNWYAVSRGTGCTDAHVIQSTIGETLDYVGPFLTEKQWKRQKKDHYDPPTPLARYDSDNVKDVGLDVRKILPTPTSASYQSKTVNLMTSKFVVVSPDDSSIVNEAQHLSAKLGLLMVPSNVAPGRNFISLRIGSIPDLPPKAGSYSLEISSASVVITGYDPSGVFYAVQSLLSLADSSSAAPGQVALGSVHDSPRFEHRGQHIDVSRNFHSVDDLKRLMDAMALYKLNRLHIHLGDDEGWRLEIPGILELTQVGSRRCHDTTGDECIMPQLGSSPHLPNTGSGYYTVDDYKSILSYAKDRHIVVIPEFDMPGHSHAAVRSMLARYRKYKDNNASEAERYLLTDLQDTSSYLSVQYFTDNAINPCVNGTYSFIQQVMSEVQKMHEAVQPLLLYHIGGDEVAAGAWLNSSKCRAQFGENITQGQVKRYFLGRINEILVSLNLTAIAWEDGLTLDQKVVDRTELFSADTWVNAWDNVWEWGTGGRAYAFANAGYKVVLNHATHLFLDFPSEPDPEERGYYWATRVIPLRKTFTYCPDDIYANIDADFDRMGSALNRSAICATNATCPSLEKPSNILGMQAQAWSETIRTSDEMDSMIFPRLLALAERAWHKADWEDSKDPPKERKEKQQADWEAFANTLGYKELRRLEDISIKYRIPLVGARTGSDSTIRVTTGLPGLPIEYRESKQQQQWTEWKTLEGSALKLNVSETIELRTRSVDGKRCSRSILVPVTIEASGGGGARPPTVEVWSLTTFVLLLLFPGWR